MPQPLLKLALHFEQIETLLFGIRPLAFEYLMQALCLQAGSRYGKVDECDTRAYVRRELDGRIASRQKHGEHRREVNVLIAERD